LAIYGDTGERTCDDSALPGKGFSAETCLLWEEAFSSMKVPATRKVLLRIGIALGKNKGALGTLANLARFYLGGTVGNGRQYVSWLHMKDLTEMFLWAIQLAEIKGVFNACGPKPITNAEFMLQLRRALHRPWSPPIPAWAVVIGSRLMGTEAELALAGRRCIPKRFQESGFEFRYPLLEEALRDLFP